MNLKLTAFLPLLAILGCSNPADNVPAAGVAAATNAPADTSGSPGAAGRSFAFGPNNSKIEFVGSKVTGSHNGSFKNFAGEFQVVDGHLAGSGNKIVIDMNSITADNDRLTGHLKTPDFFNVAQFPTATFISSSVEQKATNSTVTGNLTLHGVTKQISFPANIKVSDTEVAVTSEFFLNRFDFDVKYPGKANDLIRKEVVLKLDIKAAPGKAQFASVEAPK